MTRPTFSEPIWTKMLPLSDNSSRAYTKLR